MFDSIIGNDSIKIYLRKALQEHKLPHALLFSGPEGVGKRLFAKELAIRLLNDKKRVEAESHPDFYVFRPEGKTGFHTIEAFRHLIDEVQIACYEAPRKVLLIYDAHRMQPAAANALLKILEEPPSYAVFILITSSAQEILPTIASRCVFLRFQRLSDFETASLLELNSDVTFSNRANEGSARVVLHGLSQASWNESLFNLLSQKVPYPFLNEAIDKLEKEIDNDDPVRRSLNIECLFSAILMWHRDQTARLHGVPLFFPSAPIFTGALPSFFELERVIEEAKLAISRNIRFSVCLERVFSFLAS